MYEIIATKEKGCHNIVSFCKHIKINNQNISYLRSNQRFVTLKEIMALHKKFGYSPNWIILGVEPKRI